MMADDDSADLTLLADLRAAVRAVDPPPADLKDIALRAHGWDVELEQLAELVYDSEMAEVTAMRSTATEVRDRTYEVSEMSIEITTTPAPDGTCTLDGLVDPPVASVALMRPGTDPVTIKLDADGRFRCSLPAGLASIAVVDSAGVLIRTPLFDVG